MSYRPPDVPTMLGKRTVLLDASGGLATHMAKVARQKDVLAQSSRSDVSGPSAERRLGGASTKEYRRAAHPRGDRLSAQRA
jgi:hypothetical protein